MPNRCLGELSGWWSDVRPAGRGCLAGHSLTAVVPCCPGVAHPLRPTPGPVPGCARPAPSRHGDQHAGVSVLHHCDPSSGHLHASRGRWAPSGQPACQAERGRPRPRAAQDLHQQQSGDLGGGPGDGSQRGPRPRRGHGGRSGRLQGLTGGILAVHHRFSLEQRHCRSVPATSWRPWARRGPLLRARRTARSGSYETVSLRALHAHVGLASRRCAAHDGTAEVSSRC
jgi:hypothetical protein